MVAARGDCTSCVTVIAWENPNSRLSKVICTSGVTVTAEENTKSYQPEMIASVIASQAGAVKVCHLF